MDWNVRSSIWLRRLVVGLAVVALVWADISVGLVNVPSVYAAGQRGQSAQAMSPGSQGLSSNRVYLPLVLRQPAQVPFVFGVQIYDGLNTSGAALNLAQGANLSWVRWPFSWREIEPYDTTPDHFNWARTDASFAAAKTAGFNVIATMADNPPWAATHLAGRLDRSGVGPFVDFMAAVVERYDGDGREDAPGSPVVNYWELYNEQDGGDPIRARYGGGYWGPFGAEYAEMLCAVYPAAKAANPNAQIMFGGLAYDWFQEDGGPFVRVFLDDVLMAGGGHCVDAVAFHYYPPFESAWAPYGSGLSGKANYLRSKLTGYGLNHLPLLVTEAGYHSNSDVSWPSTPVIQAGYVIKLFTQAMASHIPVLIWFSWVDLPDYWAASGILDRNRQPKLAYDALRAARRKLGTASFQRQLSEGETGSSDVEAYLVSGVYNPIYIIWAKGATARQVSLPGNIARVSGLVDETLAKVLDGDDGSADGRITVTVGFDPVYVDIIE